MPKKSRSPHQPNLPLFDAVEESAPEASSNPLSPDNSPPNTADHDVDVDAEFSSVNSADAVSEPSTPPQRPTQPLVILVDSHSLIYQVFHALPAMTSPHGVEVGAVHGFLRDIANLLQQWNPDYLVCAFDASEETFRNELYPAYKAHREEMPEALRGQIQLIQDSLDILRIPKISLPGFEADDILATLAHRAEAIGARVLLVTSDKDCRQLISDQTSMLNLRKNELFRAEELMATWAIRPDQVVDFQSLVGDSVDNVPGVPSIGPKAAQQLLDQFGSLDGIYANLDRVAGDKKREKLAQHRDDAMLSRELVRLRIDCPFEMPWEAMKPGLPDAPALESRFRELGLRRLAAFVLYSTTSSSSSDDAPPPARRATLDASHYRCITDLAALDEVIAALRDATLI
ncbi:MAG: 5'-3' exonuclease H3TH domain-containing protein, partial [Pirellula sp.]